MNREIKFRAWNKKEKYMEIVDDLQMFSNDLSIGIPSKDYFLRKDDVELMQYTGLHDKNGKEIYEGDIVKYRDSRGQHIEKVIFDKGCFYAGMHWGSSTRVAPKLINTRISEVIGNIYDNSELLGGE